MAKRFAKALRGGGACSGTTNAGGRDVDAPSARAAHRGTRAPTNSKKKIIKPQKVGRARPRLFARRRDGTAKSVIVRRSSRTTGFTYPRRSRTRRSRVAVSATATPLARRPRASRSVPRGPGRARRTRAPRGGARGRRRRHRARRVRGGDGGVGRAPRSGFAPSAGRTPGLLRTARRHARKKKAETPTAPRRLLGRAPRWRFRTGASRFGRRTAPTRAARSRSPPSSRVRERSGLVPPELVRPRRRRRGAPPFARGAGVATRARAGRRGALQYKYTCSPPHLSRHRLARAASAAWLGARAGCAGGGRGPELVASRPPRWSTSRARRRLPASAALPEYHPRVMMDWLVRADDAARARASAARRARSALEATAHPSTDPGWLNVPASVCGATVAQRLPESAVCLEPDGSGNSTSAAAAARAVAPARVRRSRVRGCGGRRSAARARERRAGAFRVRRGYDASERTRTLLERPRRVRPVHRGGGGGGGVRSRGAARRRLCRASPAPTVSECWRSPTRCATPRRRRRRRRRSRPAVPGVDARARYVTPASPRTRAGAAPLRTRVARGGKSWRGRCTATRKTRLDVLRLCEAAGDSGPVRSAGLESAPTGDASWRALRLAGAPLWVRDDETLRKLGGRRRASSFSPPARDPGGENPRALLFARRRTRSTTRLRLARARDARRWPLLRARLFRAEKQRGGVEKRVRASVQATVPVRRGVLRARRSAARRGGPGVETRRGPVAPCGVASARIAAERRRRR